MKEIFSDGIANIVLSHGLVLIDFYHLIPWKDDPVEQVPFLRLTMPLSGFVRLFDVSQDVLERLIKNGVFIAKPVSPENAPVPAEKKKAKKKDAKAAPAKPAAKSAPAKKAAPAPAKKAEAPAKPAAKSAPAKKAAPAPAKKAEAPAKPAAKSAPVQKPGKGKKHTK